jgi:hypothetical protein
MANNFFVWRWTPSIRLALGPGAMTAPEHCLVLEPFRKLSLGGCQSPEHEADHGEAHEGGGDTGLPLEVLDEAAAARDPGEGAFDDPSFGDDLEAWRVATVDDLDGPATDSRKGGSERRSQVVGIGKDALEERKQASGVRGSD